MSYLITLFRIFIFISTTAGLHKDAYNTDGSASLIVINRGESEVIVKSDYWMVFPFSGIEKSVTIPGGSSGMITIPVPGRLEYRMFVEDDGLSVFTEPGVTDTLVVFPGRFEFHGPMARINEYLYARDQFRGGPGKTTQYRAQVTQMAADTREIFALNDSVYQAGVQFLESYPGELPGWYRLFEEKRSFYLNEGFKLNSIFYRNSLMGMSDRLSPAYLWLLSENDFIHAPEMLGDIKYLQFLTDYVHAFGERDVLYEKPSSSPEWSHRFRYFDSLAVDMLRGPVKDIYLSHSFSKRIDSHPLLFQGESLGLIDNDTLRSMLLRADKENQLTSGTRMPYFYLESTNGGFSEAVDFRGKVTLINFWATWCKPCIEEFPEENGLVDKFSHDQVEIINVCLESERDTWKKYVDKYDLSMTNLFANESWSAKLREQYGIGALPHSVLVGADGKIVMNNAPRASSGVEKLIQEALLNYSESDSP